MNVELCICILTFEYHILCFILSLQNHLFYIQQLTNLISHLDLSFNLCVINDDKEDNFKKVKSQDTLGSMQHEHFHGLVKTQSQRHLDKYCIHMAEVIG